MEYINRAFFFLLIRLFIKSFNIDKPLTKQSQEKKKLILNEILDEYMKLKSHKIDLGNNDLMVKYKYKPILSCFKNYKILANMIFYTRRLNIIILLLFFPDYSLSASCHILQSSSVLYHYLFNKNCLYLFPSIFSKNNSTEKHKRG
jgi:hypothetical protein